MVAILLAIWEFLVALGPFLTAIGGVLASLATAIWEITKIYAAVLLLVGAFEILFDPRGKQRVGNFLANVVGGALAVATPVLAALTPSLQGIVSAFATAFATTGPGLADTVAEPIGQFAASNFNSTITALSGVAESTADNSVAQAATAIKDAFGKGLSATTVAASFESLFPEKLNMLNSVAPLLGQMAGFADVSAAIREPLYRAAFGRSAEYKFNAQFTPNLPDSGHATEWLARRIIGQAEFDTLFEPTGIKGEYQVNYEAAAYRPISPRLLTNLLVDQPFDSAKVQHLLEDAGISPINIDFLLPAYEFNSVKALRQQYVASLEKSAELGSISEPELKADLAAVGYSATAQNMIALTVSQRILDTLLGLFRRETDILFQTNQIPAASYVNSLEIAGMSPQLADAYFGIATARVNGRGLAASVREAAKLEAQKIRLNVQAAKTAFLAGEIDAVAMAAAIAISGLDLSLQPITVALLETTALARRQSVAGLLLPRNQAILLREKIAATKEATIKKLITIDAAKAQLTGYGIPAVNVEALIAEYSAQLKLAPALRRDARC